VHVAGVADAGIICWDEDLCCALGLLRGQWRAEEAEGNEAGAVKEMAQGEAAAAWLGREWLGGGHGVRQTGLRGWGVNFRRMDCVGDMVACFGRNLVLNSNPNALRSPMTLKTCLWIAAGFMVMGLIGLNGYYARHPVFESLQEGFRGAAQAPAGSLRPFKNRGTTQDRDRNRKRSRRMDSENGRFKPSLNKARYSVFQN
jgi:hypothetical protein